MKFLILSTYILVCYVSIFYNFTVPVFESNLKSDLQQNTQYHRYREVFGKRWKMKVNYFNLPYATKIDELLCNSIK